MDAGATFVYVDVAEKSSVMAAQTAMMDKISMIAMMASKGELMRKSKYLRLYEAMCPSDAVDNDPRHPMIIAEMRDLVRAKTNREATDAIEWWGWNSDQELMAWVVKARKLWEKMK